MIMHQYAKNGFHVAAHQRYVQLFIILFFSFYIALSQGQGTTTACTNSCAPILPRYVDFSEGEKSEYPQSTGQINYGKSTSNTTPDLFPVSCQQKVFGVAIIQWPTGILCGLCCTVHNVTHSSFFTVNSIDILKLK